MVEMRGGSVDGASADIRLLQTLAWPVSADVPGLIIMASTSTMEGGDAIITFYADLIAQNGTAGESDKDAFTAAMRPACEKHGRDLAEYQAFLTGRGMLGACAAECGMLYFFEESDAAFLDDCIAAALQAYRLILEAAGSRAGGDANASWLNAAQRSRSGWSPRTTVSRWRARTAYRMMLWASTGFRPGSEHTAQKHARQYRETDMAKKIGKEPSWEQQKKLLLESVALKMPLLHQSLVAAYGEGEGRRIYDELYEAAYKKRLQHFKDKDIVDVISAEIDVFPALGWKIWMDVCEENGDV